MLHAVTIYLAREMTFIRHPRMLRCSLSVQDLRLKGAAPVSSFPQIKFHVTCMYTLSFVLFNALSIISSENIYQERTLCLLSCRVLYVFFYVSMRCCREKGNENKSFSTGHPPQWARRNAVLETWAMRSPCNVCDSTNLYYWSVGDYLLLRN